MSKQLTVRMDADTLGQLLALAEASDLTPAEAIRECVNVAAKMRETYRGTKTTAADICDEVRRDALRWAMFSPSASNYPLDPQVYLGIDPLSLFGEWRSASKGAAVGLDDDNLPNEFRFVPSVAAGESPDGTSRFVMLHARHRLGSPAVVDGTLNVVDVHSVDDPAWHAEYAQFLFERSRAKARQASEAART